MRRIKLLFQTIRQIERSSIIQLDELLWNTAFCNMHALQGVNTICIASLKMHFSALSHRDYLKFVIYNPICLLQTGEFPRNVKNAILKKNPLSSFNHTERSPINKIFISFYPQSGQMKLSCFSEIFLCSLPYSLPHFSPHSLPSSLEQQLSNRPK